MGVVALDVTGYGRQVTFHHALAQLTLI